MNEKEKKVRNLGINLCFITMCAMRILNWNTLPSFFKFGTVVLTIAVTIEFIIWIVTRIRIRAAIKDLITEEANYLNSTLNEYLSKEKSQRETFNDELRFVIDICECDIEDAKELKKVAHSKKKEQRIDDFIKEAENILKQLKAIKKRDSI